jgi:hypothetical protein
MLIKQYNMPINKYLNKLISQHGYNGAITPAKAMDLVAQVHGYKDWEHVAEYGHLREGWICEAIQLHTFTWVNDIVSEHFESDGSEYYWPIDETE